VTGRELSGSGAPGSFLAYSTDLGLTWTAYSVFDVTSDHVVCWNPVEQCFVALFARISGGDIVVLKSLSTGTGGGTSI
jgi:hypothetical protein